VPSALPACASVVAGSLGPRGPGARAAAASSRWTVPGCRVSRVSHADGPAFTDGLAYWTVWADAGSVVGFCRFLASGSHTDRVTDSSARHDPLTAGADGSPAGAGACGPDCLTGPACTVGLAGAAAALPAAS